MIVYGVDEDNFIKNLRTIFERLAKYKCVLKPSKCQFGLTKIEYVGRVLFFDESTMGDETIRKVLDFLLPTKVKQLSSFIGLVQYFRNYIYAFYEVKEKLSMQTKLFGTKKVNLFTCSPMQVTMVLGDTCINSS